MAMSNPEKKQFYFFPLSGFFKIFVTRGGQHVSRKSREKKSVSNLVLAGK